MWMHRKSRVIFADATLSGADWAIYRRIPFETNHSHRDELVRSDCPIAGQAELKSQTNSTEELKAAISPCVSRAK
jgi:hypothetical protein